MIVCLAWLLYSIRANSTLAAAGAAKRFRLKPVGQAGSVTTVTATHRKSSPQTQALLSESIVSQFPSLLHRRPSSARRTPHKHIITQWRNPADRRLESDDSNPPVKALKNLKGRLCFVSSQKRTDLGPPSEREAEARK
jgi:hypothetical protein